MRLLLLWAALFFAAFEAPSAWAEVKSSSATAFEIAGEADVAADPGGAMRAITRIGRWWSSDHTYSGDAANLSLDAHAGGCFCERWNGGSVEHGRVVLAFERDGVRQVRILGALGPLQEMGVTGVLTFTVTPRQGGAAGAHVTMTYRVSGEPGLGLDHLAAPVDHVIMEQFDRLIRYTDTGAPS